MDSRAEDSSAALALVIQQLVRVARGMELRCPLDCGDTAYSRIVAKGLEGQYYAGSHGRTLRRSLHRGVACQRKISGRAQGASGLEDPGYSERIGSEPVQSGSRCT